MVAWQASEPVYRSNLISLGLTNNPCQNVSAYCGRGRSWICHTGMQVKQWPSTTSPSNTGLRTLISFMTVPNLAFFRFRSFMKYKTYDNRKSIYHNMSCTLFCNVRPSIVTHNTCNNCCIAKNLLMCLVLTLQHEHIPVRMWCCVMGLQHAWLSVWQDIQVRDRHLPHSVKSNIY